MSAAMAAPKTGFKFMLQVRAGPDRGAIYQLLPPKVTIGRGTDNHVTLADPRVSRQAALIEFSIEKIVVHDLTDRQALNVNQQPTRAASIKDGDVIRLGDSELVFIVEAVIIAPNMALMNAPSGPSRADRPQRLDSFGAMSARSTASARSAAPSRGPAASGDSGRLRFYLIAGIFLGAIVYMGTTQNKQKKPDIELRTVEKVEKEVQLAESRIESLEKQRRFRSEEERTRFEEAQRHYLEGFRDYQKGQWARAMKSFETARAIDPEHKQAQRYFILAEKRRDEMVSMLILEGKRYLDKHMFTRCSAALDKALDSIPNKEDLRYKQAEAVKKECDLRQEDRFR